MQFQHSENAVKVYGENGEVLAQIDFPTVGENVVEANHTFVSDSLRGKGVAGKLMEEMVNNLQESQRKVIPTCSYAVKWFEKHEEFANLIVR